MHFGQKKDGPRIILVAEIVKLGLRILGAENDPSKLFDFAEIFLADIDVFIYFAQFLQSLSEFKISLE